MPLIFAILAIIAFFVVAGWIIGFAIELIGLGVAAFIVVAAVSWIMSKVRGPRRRDRMDGPVGRERLRR